MNSAILLVALAAWCACAAPPAAAAAAYRTRRGSIPLEMCPEGTVPHYGLCVKSQGDTPNRIVPCPPGYVPFDNKCILVPNVDDVAVPEQKSEAPKPGRAKRMIGMFSGVPYFNDCPEDYFMFADGSCVQPREPLPGPVGYEDYINLFT